MKKCKIIHINDAHERELEDGDRFYAEDYPRTEEMINGYLEEGYVVKQVVQSYMPNISKEGSYSFFLNGYTFYLEKEE